ncbi:hypothetical protein [Planctomicrobium sp. SH527]|uniref:hypothetical protein n=1 Tax=Planctomicrobium sp. SH527 TaxID=3448123 RepID=UPI003F5B64B8
MAEEHQKSSIHSSHLRSKVVDRHARSELAALIERFLASEITAFQFDAELDNWGDSHDPVIQYVVESVWYFYDDCKDHFVVMTKADWDYFQRLLLLLKADCSIQTVRTRKWSWTQLVAAGCLVMFGTIVFLYGWGEFLVLTTIPLGIISLLLARQRSMITSSLPLLHQQISPFASFTNLWAAHDSVEFKKQRYPRELSTRRIRSDSISGMPHPYLLVLVWLIYSPIILFSQLFPITTAITTAKLRESEPDCQTA